MSSSRRQYPFHLIEPKWQQTWEQEQAFRAFNPNEEIPANHPFGVRHGLSGKIASAEALPKKFYILDMFPYPSGAGLHVGHPEGYTATDILARYRRACGFNVLHPMGWDSFGLPAEQYAVKTGQHPRVTTEANIANFTRQIKSLGFSYDWSRELATTDVEYFKWTQWIFLKLYNSWFNPETNKAESVDTIKFPADCKSEEQKRAFRDSKRLAYVSEAPVNWCPELGTVLANEEVIDGKSEVGGFPVIRKPMRQWMLRITAYAEKLLADLDTIDWTDSLKEMQRNWIGRSEGAEVDFQIADSRLPVADAKIRVFTTRPDTLFGATYMVLAPEHRLVDQIIPSHWPAGTPDGWKGRLEHPGSKLEGAGQGLETRDPTLETGGAKLEAGGTTLGGPVSPLEGGGGKLDKRVSPLETPGDKLEAHASKLDNRGAALEGRGATLEERGGMLDERGRRLEIGGSTLETHISAENAQNRGFATPQAAVAAYRALAAGKSDLERTELAKEKSGVFTGAYAINPVNGEKIPIWIADYVLASYGTGAIMAVPAHDERDWEFAKKFSLPIEQVVIPIGLKPLEISPKNFIGGAIGPLEKPFCEEGIAISSPESGWRLKDLSGERCDINGLPTAEAKNKISAWLEEKGLGKKTINYKLRDWLFSRQRYWGEPFPIIWKKDAAGNLYHEAVPEKSLPVLPPVLEDYKPTADGQPPLARATAWVNLKSGAVRETNTMPQWAGSCWYYLRYLAADHAARFTDKDAELYWLGGARRPGNFLLTSPDQWSAEVENLIHRAFVGGKRPPYAVEFAPVSDALAAQVKAAAQLEVEGFRHSLDVFAVRHIFNEHGNSLLEEARGNLAVTRDDLKWLPQMLAAPDAVEFSASQPRGFKRLIIRKRINGYFLVVEEVRGKNHQLQIVTCYKRAATARDVTTKAPLSDTSETLRHIESNKPDATPTVKPTPGVDLYVGGTEHAVLHLLYARFWHKVLFDLGYVSTPEPFYKLVNQGLILGEDGQKMSKSRGNVVNPDDVLVEYGADAFRLYEMFMGPLQDTKPWNTKGVEGVYRFLGRVWRLFVDEKSETAFEQAETTAENKNELLDLILLDGGISDLDATPAQLKALHACIKKVTEDLDGMRFNTAISAMMVFINEAMTWQNKPLSVMKTFLQLLAPFAPHIAEELWARLHSTFGQVSTSLAYAPWPKFDAALLVESEIEIPVQVNGKLRDVIKVSVNATAAELEALALANEKAKPYYEGKTIKKVIVVPKKLVNIVAA